MLALLVVVFWVSLFVMMTNSQLQFTSAKQQLQHLYQEGIDVVLVAPVSEKTLLSIKKYMGWIRNIHIQNKDIYQDTRIIPFKQELVHYSMTSPLLSEHFVIIQPGWLFTDYVFASQFFINKQPVVRKSLGKPLAALTRKIFNENSFYDHKVCPVVFALQHGIKNKSIVLKDKSLTSVIHESDYHSIIEIEKSIDRFVVVVVEDYTSFQKLNAKTQVWIVLNKRKPMYSWQRLRFYQQAGTVVEIDVQPNLEKLAVAAVRSICGKPEMIYAKSDGIANAIANKMALVYETSFAKI